MGVLYGGLGRSKLQFLINKIEIKFPAIIFFNFSSSNPGSGSAIRKNAGSGSVSGSALNQCGSETLSSLFPFTNDIVTLISRTNGNKDIISLINDKKALISLTNGYKDPDLPH
jgi:hypothetical protein